MEHLVAASECDFENALLSADLSEMVSQANRERVSGTSARSIPSSYLGLSNWPDRMREGGTVPKVGKLVIGRHFVGSGRRRRAGREARRPRKEGGSDGNVASAWMDGRVAARSPH